MAREFKRSDRVAEVIQREISMLLITSVKDPRISLVTITGAKVTNDFRYATVYYAMQADEAKRKEAQKGLESAAGFFRSHLRQVTDLRHIPEIRFKYDVSLDQGERIDQLLREVKARDEE
jgi:ribosome-binding factor A